MKLNVDVSGLSVNEKYAIRSRFNRDLIRQVAETDGIKNYNGEGYNILYAPNLEFTLGNGYNALNSISSKVRKEMGREAVLTLEIMQHRPKIFGVIDSSMVDYFMNGAFSLIEGRHIQKNDRGKVLITESVAQKNNLKIGDSVYIETNEFIVTNQGSLDNIYESYNLEIVGIFRINAMQAINFYTFEFEIAENYMFTDLETNKSMSVIMSSGSDAGVDKATFAVENPEEANDIIDKIKARKDIDVRNYKFEIDDSVYQSSAQPLKMISKVISIAITIILIDCLLLLIIILKMWLTSRNMEIGILMSIGAEKRKIALEFFIETMVIIAIACCAAFLAASIISKPISNWVIKAVTPEQVLPAEKSQKELEADMLEGNFDIAGEIIIPVQLPDEFNSRPTAIDLVIILSIFLLITTGALGTTFYLYFGMTPKNILNKMSG